jgi:branched-chain amino acid transport system substrate-binding protein
MVRFGVRWPVSLAARAARAGGCGRAAAVVLCAAVVVVPLAACSSGSSSSGGAASAASAGGTSGSAAAAGGGVINVGVIGGFSGTQASSADPAEQGIEAWADSVNAAGGLAGHKVNLIIKDDQDSASLGVADAKELVTQDKVAAVLADWSNTDIQWGPYLKQQGVPVIGGANLAESLQDSDYFPVGTDGNSQATVMMQAAAKAGVTKLAVAYCSEAPACAEVDSLVKASQAASGVKVSWSGGFSQTAPSYTAQCLAAKNSGANGMFIAAASEADVRFATACAQQGYKPIEVTLGSTATPDWAQVPAFNGMVDAILDAPWTDTSTPATRAFHTAMAAYQPGKQLGTGTMQAWVAGVAFAQAYKDAGSPANPTPANITKGLYAFHDETLGGLAPPLTYTPGQPGKVPCAFIISIQNGKFSEPQGLTTTCAT